MSALTTPEHLSIAVLDARDAYARYYPGHDPARLARAVELVLEGAVLGQQPDGCYLVQSSTPGGYYRTHETSCSCADSRQRNVICKHSIALVLALAADPSHQPIAYAVTIKADAPLGLPCPRCAVPTTTPASARAVVALGCCLACVNAELDLDAP